MKKISPQKRRIIRQKRRKKRITIGMSLLIMVVLGVVCVNAFADQEVVVEETVAKEQRNTTPSEIQETKSSEIIVRDGDVEVDDEILMPIENFFRVNFDDLSSLTSTDITTLFYEPEAENAKLNQAALQYMIELRSGQSNDLTMSSYLCGLTFTDVSESYGEIEVSVLEDHTVNFSFLANTDSSSSGIEHYFTLVETAAGYMISEHYKEEDSFLMIEAAVDEGLEPYQAEQELLNSAFDAVADNEAQKLGFNNGMSQERITEAENDYDREAAVKYALKWVDPIEVVRNDSIYGVYDTYGGNCNNYISQCLFAGGIPMDTDGDLYEQWKWYGENVDAYQEDYGRSPSFTGVNEFYSYASYNSGYGLVAVVDDNLFSGQEGDILQYGYEDNWMHSVIVTNVVEDDSGDIVDYLINSNTTDRINYPASAYGYPQMRIIKIVGWNDEEL
ncbi:amidase domain-containing protein [Eubacteriaceae bacterium ES3]|nr:amidase domain-containing protein [Eubacteriaceae bacterium ES3]